MTTKTTTAQTAQTEVTAEVKTTTAQAKFADTYRYIEELGIWVHHELSTYDKKMITRARNKQIKAQAAAAAAAETTQTEATTAETAETEVTAEVAIKTAVEAVAYGADGQVLSYDETVEAIANRQGWFDRQGRWVNYARMMQEARAMLAAN
jgi:hypothetical protein